jgi:hypothetical protein
MAKAHSPSAADDLVLVGLDDLLHAGWRICDLRGTPPATLADLVLIGQPGLFVIRALRSTKPRHVERALQGLRDSTSALADIAGVHEDEAHGVLCFTETPKVDAWRDNIILCSPDNLVEIVGARRPKLDEVDEVDEAEDRIFKATQPNGRHRSGNTRTVKPLATLDPRPAPSPIDPVFT